MKNLQMLETISPMQAQLRETNLHEAECGNDLHTAEHLANAIMLRAGGRLKPSDRYVTLDMILKTIPHGCHDGREARLHVPTC
jgi:hypothetical protein